MGSTRTKKCLLSFLLSLAMVITMLPGNYAKKAKAADAVMYVTMHYDNQGGYETPTLQYWGGSGQSVTGNNGSGEITGWGGVAGYKLTKDADGFYSVTVKGNVEGFQFLDFEGDHPATGDIYKSSMAKYSQETPTDLYYIKGSWYLDAQGKTALPEAAGNSDAYLVAGASALCGSNWSITDKNNFLTKEESTGMMAITYENVAPGTYEYKILQDPENNGWNKPWGDSSNRKLVVSSYSNITIKLNPADTTNMEVTVDQEPLAKKSLVLATNYAIVGGSNALETAADYFDGVAEAAKKVDVTFSLAEAQDGVTIKDNVITVNGDFTGTTVKVNATYDGYTQETELKAVAHLYTVNINMYAQNLAMEPGVSDIYIFNKKGSENVFVPTTGTYKDDENDVTWVTATVKLPYNELGCIIRDEAGSWSAQDSSGMAYTIDLDETKPVTLWYVYGKTPVTEKPVITQEQQRYFYLEYTNAQAAADKITPQFYSWTTGYAAKLMDMEDKGDGNYEIKVPVKGTCTKVDFVIALDASGDPWVKDGGDHSISMPLAQRVVCAKMDAGSEPQLSCPYNTGYEINPKENKISYYYRDDQALIDGNLADLKVAVDVNGTEKEMTYSAKNKRFEYTDNALADGKIDYRYHVGDAYVLDTFNAQTETVDDVDYSWTSYYKLDAAVEAKVTNSSFNYDENDVVSFEMTGKDADKVKVASASIDCSELGGGIERIDARLQEVTIAVTKDTAVGEKNLPIVVCDQYGNEYTGSAKVTVVAKEAKENDFDWDEASIYFMVTDRFFDGNKDNNQAAGEGTYGTNPGLYHGGDFAGVTEKLDYLKNLGINTIWMTPIVENIPGVDVTGEGAEDVPYNAAYHGYWASDFTKLNPELGSKEEFKTLIDQAHAKGIKIMVDIVVNHAGYGTEESDNFKGMFRDSEDTIMGDDKLSSLSNMPDFATEKDSVRKQLVEWQTAWMKDYAIDYYRVDTVKHVDDTTWAALKNSTTKVNPSFKMIGEYSGAGYASNGGVLGSGEMDSILDFDFNDKATQFVKGGMSSVEEFLAKRNQAINNTYETGQFLGSHDEIGFKQNLEDGGMTESDAQAAALVAASLQITAKGQPVIYYGEELGQTGENNYPYQTNRYDLDWSLATDNNITYSHYKKLLNIRKENSALFARGDRTVLACNDEKGYDIVKRSLGDGSVVVGLNTNNEEKQVALTGLKANATYEDLYNGTVVTADAVGTCNITLPAGGKGGTVILKEKKGDAPSILPTQSPNLEPTVTPSAQPSQTPGVTPSEAPASDTDTSGNNTKVTKPAKVKAVKAVRKGKAKTSVKISWKKVSGAKGYQIQVSTNKKFKKAKTYTLTKGSSISKTIKGCKAKTTYYIRVRAYKKSSSKKITGAYSTTVKLKHTK